MAFRPVIAAARSAAGADAPSSARASRNMPIEASAKTIAATGVSA
jgi:hypothetical protein